MAKELNKAQVNHLRRLLGWVRCEIPPSPDEVVKIVHGIAPVIDNEDAKQKMVAWHREAASVPKYIRAALKALEPVVAEAKGEIVDAVSVHKGRSSSATQAIASQMVLSPKYAGLSQQRLLPSPCAHGLWLCDLCDEHGVPKRRGDSGTGT